MILIFCLLERRMILFWDCGLFDKGKTREVSFLDLRLDYGNVKKSGDVLIRDLGEKSGLVCGSM